jgi:hypothetical protein
MPSSTVNVPVLFPEGFWGFSDFSDNLNLQNFSQIGKSPVRIYAGNDRRIASWVAHSITP